MYSIEDTEKHTVQNPNHSAKNKQSKILIIWATAPLFIFLILLFFLKKSLHRDPTLLKSPLIGKEAPAFSLPILFQEPCTQKKTASFPPNRQTTGTECTENSNSIQSMKDATWSPKNLLGQVWLLNVWASWCVPCQYELPFLAALKEIVPVIGLLWKDTPENTKDFLDQLSTPYNLVIIDQNGRTGMNYGISGIPESFLIDRKGIIRWKQVGPITEETLNSDFLKTIEQLKQE